MAPVVYFDAAGDEDDAGAGGGPDGQWDHQHHEEQLLANIN